MIRPLFALLFLFNAVAAPVRLAHEGRALLPVTFDQVLNGWQKQGNVTFQAVALSGEKP